jgi:hypothetical protein
MINKLRSIFNRFRRLVQRFFRKSSTFNRQPLNGGSLVVIILIDIFILINVFLGLHEISSWHLSPDSTYPCYSQWRNYRQSKEVGKDYDIVNQAIGVSSVEPDRESPSLYSNYQQSEVGHLGKVDARCLNFADLQDALSTPDNKKNVVSINAKLSKIIAFEDSNRSIRQQYDSTLLERVAGQAPNQSINNVSAEKAKQTLDANNASIKQLNQEVGDLKRALLAQPQAIALLSRFQDANAFGAIEKAYGHAAFWYPSIQLGFQALFLVPLILLFGTVHRFAVRKNYGLVALISWHLLIISVIPTFLKLFEFLQVGALVQWLATAIANFFGGLLFLISYVRILLIPLAGFGLIKLIQRASKSGVNPQLQAATRILESRCLNCAKKIRPEDAHCYHCGYQQYAECPSCYTMTHRHMPHCTHCGAETNFDPNLIRRSTREARSAHG